MISASIRSPGPDPAGQDALIDARSRNSLRKPVSHSQTWTFFGGQWHEGNVPIMGPRTHGLWLGSTVFDGARAFEGVTPDLDRHCARVNQSAAHFWLQPIVE